MTTDRLKTILSPHAGKRPNLVSPPYLGLLLGTVGIAEDVIAYMLV
jgi:hypothetical protein